MKLKKLVRHLVENNDVNFNCTKCAEEAAELADVLLKKVNKQKYLGNEDINPLIAGEAADLTIRLKVLIKMLGLEDAVKVAIDNKVEKLSGYIEKGLYPNTI